MKFTIKKQLLDQTIEFLSKFINSIDAFVAFRYILLEVEEEKLTFTASNSTMAAKKILNVDEIDIKVEETGSILINCSYFKNIIKKLNENIEISTQNDLIHIVEGNTIYKLNTIADKYPEISFSTTDNVFQIEKREFEKAIRNVIFATGENLSSTILKCVNIQSENKSLRFAATDTARLSMETIKIDKDLNMNLSIDGKNIKNLISKDAPKIINVFFNNTRFGIYYENTIIQTNLVDLPYHDITKVFPKKFDRKIVIKKDVLLSLINKVVFTSIEKGGRIELNIKSDELIVSTNVSEIGNSTATTTDFLLEGEPIEIDFNPSFLRDSINIIDGEMNIFINPEGKIVLIISKSNPNNKQLLSTIRRI